MIHDWIVYDDQHQACRRCGLRLWRRGAGAWQAVTSNGVPAPFGLLPDGSRVECSRPRNQLPGVVVIDYTGDPDIHPGCERFMHRVRDEADPPSSALAVPAAAPTACGFPAVAWELGAPRLHVGWTWCLDCFPDRAKDGARQRLAPPAHVKPDEARRWAELEERAERQRQARQLAAVRQAEVRAAAKEAKRAGVVLRFCRCSKCAGGLPPQIETVREIQSIQRRPKGWNPR
jgi:hypothetical protein